MGKENGNTHTMSSEGPSSSTCTYNKLGEVLDAPWLKVRYFVIALCDNKSHTLLDVGGVLLSELKNQITMCEMVVIMKNVRKANVPFHLCGFLSQLGNY